MESNNPEVSIGGLFALGGVFAVLILVMFAIFERQPNSPEFQHPGKKVVIKFSEKCRPIAERYGMMGKDVRLAPASYDELMLELRVCEGHAIKAEPTTPAKYVEKH